MTAICVFTSARSFTNAPWEALAAETGTLIAEQGWNLVYGGSASGCMNACACAAKKAGSHVTGVFLEALRHVEPPNHDIDELVIAEDMHARKATMATLSCAYLVLPGGLGTMEEFFEVWSHAKIGLHEKPIVLVNAHGYYNKLIAFLQHAEKQKMFDAAHLEMAPTVNSPREAITYLSGLL